MSRETYVLRLFTIPWKICFKYAAKLANIPSFTCTLKILVLVGLVSTGVSAWQTIGWWGTFYPTVNRPWWNQAVWDTCGCCSDSIQDNKFFGLVNAIFGYQVHGQ